MSEILTSRRNFYDRDFSKNVGIKRNFLQMSIFLFIRRGGGGGSAVQNVECERFGKLRAAAASVRT